MAKIHIFICGGHFSPAIAIIEELAKESNLKIYYLGRKYSQEKDKTLSLEYKEITRNNLEFLFLTTGRLSRFISWESLISLFKLPIGFLQSLNYMIKYKPKLIISFGSYVALPVCFIGYLFGIPVITHEQTRIMGLSNRLISLIASFVCLTYSDTKKVPRGLKTITTGIPLRDSILNPDNTGITKFGNIKQPLIYITGGSLGSTSINSVITKIVPDLLKKYRLFHVCGESLKKYDYHRLSKLRMGFDAKLRDNYYITPVLDYQKVGEVLKTADLIIGRSGANTIAEIAFHKKKAILIPLPWGGKNEQLENALYLKEIGISEIIEQKNLNPIILQEKITDMLETYKDINNKYLSVNWFTQGKEKLAGLIKYQLNSLKE